MGSLFYIHVDILHFVNLVVSILLDKIMQNVLLVENLLGTIPKYFFKNLKLRKKADQKKLHCELLLHKDFVKVSK